MLGGIAITGIPTLGGLRVTNDGTITTLLGRSGDYIRIGDADTTSYSLNSEDDLMVTGKLEVDGRAYFDGIVDLNSWVNFSNGLTATTNGVVLQTAASTDNYLLLKAMNTGAAQVEVARFQGAADPHFAVNSEEDGRHLAFNYGNIAITNFKVVKVTKAHGSDLFDATATTDNVTIWTQPTNSRLIAVMMRLETKFTATGTVAFSGVAAALDVVTVGIDGSDATLTEGTEWNRGASAADSALSLAAAIEALTGLSATSAAGTTVTVTPDAGYVLTNLIDTTDGGGVMTAAFLSDLRVTMGLAGNEDSLVTTTGNLTLDAVDTEYEDVGAYYDAFKEGIHGKTNATIAWKAFATSTGRNLDVSTAGTMDFYFIYEQP